MKDVLDKAGHITAAEFQRTREAAVAVRDGEVGAGAGGALSALVAAGVTAEVTQSGGERVFLTQPTVAAQSAQLEAEVGIEVAVDLPRRVTAGGGVDGIGDGNGGDKAHRVTLGDQAVDRELQARHRIGIVLQRAGENVPGRGEPVAAALALARVGSELGVGEASGLLELVGAAGDAEVAPQLVVDAVAQGGVQHVGAVFAVLAPAVTLAVVVEGVVGKVAHRAAHRIVGTPQPVAAKTLPAFDAELAVGRGLADAVVEQPAELRTELKPGGATHQRDRLHRLGRRVVVGFGIAVGVRGDIDAVLPHVELPGAVRAQPAAGHADLHARAVAFPHAQPRRLAEKLPRLVLHGVYELVVEPDLFGLLPGHQLHRLHLPQPLPAPLPVPLDIHGLQGIRPGDRRVGHRLLSPQHTGFQHQNRQSGHTQQSQLHPYFYLDLF